MTQAAHVFPSFAQNLGTNAQKASTDGISVALIASATFNWVTATQLYTTLAQFLANAGSGGGGALTEVSTTNTGYSRQALTGITFTESGLISTLTAATPLTWTCPTAASSGVGWSAYFAVFYDTTAGSGANDLICYWDFGGPTSVTPGGTFALNINASGLVTLTSS
jgi:hypothetical protein